MRDKTACGVFASGTFADAKWLARCFDHDPFWAGPPRAYTDAGMDKAIADADRHDRTEHPNE